MTKSKLRYKLAESLFKSADMIFGSLMMAIAITISAIAAWYSIAGLTAIFSAAVIPVMIMGGALEAGKIAATVWLHNNWERAGWKFKTYLIPAVLFLMILTSLGIFGFLSKAHSDQGLITSDAASKVAIYDEKIATERENIDQAKRALEQMNAQVDQMLGRTDSDTGAQRAVNIRKQQARERAELQSTISKSQKEIQRLQQERAPLAAETRKIEAEVGPIKYIAALIYGDDPDQNVLERAVRWVIILIVVVFDPLALTLILAANRQFEWARSARETVSRDDPAIESEPSTQPHDQDNPEQPEPESEQDFGECPKCNSKLVNAEGIAIYCPNKQCEVFDAPDLYRDQEIDNFFQQARFAAQAIDMHNEQQRAQEANAKIAELPEWYPEPDISSVETQETQLSDSASEQQPSAQYEPDDGPLTDEQMAQVEQQAQNTHAATVEESTSPEETTNIAEESDLVDEFNTPIRRGNDYAVRYRGKIYNLDAFNKLYPTMAIQADNESADTSKQCGFGDRFPDNPVKGDMWIRTDYLPDRLFKFNGQKWIELDKSSTDSYTYNTAYIQHLIAKLEAGEYDIEDLSEAEQIQVEQEIQRIINSKKNA